MNDTAIGEYLRNARTRHGMSIEEIARTTRIPLRMLEHIEADRFDQLPGDVFARGFLRSYARAVHLDCELVLRRYGQICGDSIAPPTVLSLTPPERGRRFGIAIALVVLLVLFTLAISIMLRPRPSDVPSELSLRSEPCLEPELQTPTRSSCAASRIAMPTESSRF